MKRILAVFILGIVVLFVAVLFGQVLGGFYIYNLIVEDNPNIMEKKEIVNRAPIPVPPKKVLRLEPIEFFTIQAGIFQEGKDAQDSIGKLASLGLRPYVTKQSPFKVLIGCFSEVDSGRELEAALKKQGFEAFIGKGLINDRALKFPGDDQFMIEDFAPLLGKFDLILKHSLKMFQSPKISSYELNVWGEMIEKVLDEVNSGLTALDQILQMSQSKAYQKELLKLKDTAEAYNTGLSNIINLKSDTGVISSQGQLLELIAAYHNLINQANFKLDSKI